MNMKNEETSAKTAINADQRMLILGARNTLDIRSKFYPYGGAGA